jgi:hypothetical protein
VSSPFPDIDFGPPSVCINNIFRKKTNKNKNKKIYVGMEIKLKEARHITHNNKRKKKRERIWHG